MKAGMIVVAFIAATIISGFHGYLFHSFASLLLLTGFLIVAYPFSAFLLGRGTNAIVFAFPIGYILHALLLSTIAVFTKISGLTFGIYITAFAGLSFFLYRRLIPAAEENKWNESEIRHLFLWIAAALVVLSLPFIRVGTPVNEGFAYRAYFNTDFFRHMAVAANLANHGIPPDNPYFSGHVLRYYWFFHIIPAYWIKIFPGYSLDYMMVQFNLAVALMFAATMYAAVRNFTTRARSRSILLALFLFGGSYEGIYILYQLHQKNLSWMAFRDWNVDAILRWFWGAPQVDTLFRSMLYAPQHLIGLSFFLLLLICWKTESTFLQRMLIYILLFAVTGFTVIIAGALILGSAFLVLAEALGRDGVFASETKRIRAKKWAEILVAGIAGITFLASYFYLFQMFGTGAGDVKFEVNQKVLQNLGGYFVLNWGAILVGGVAGIIHRTAQIPAKTLLFYLLLCILFIFFINIQVPGSSEITLKMGFLSYVILLLFAAGFLDRVNLPTKILAPLILLILVPAFATWGMDFYNNQDIKNNKFTTIISKDDAMVYRWMKENAEVTATAQNYTAGGEGFLEEYVTEIPAMAQRTTYLGDKVHSRLYQISDDDLTVRERVVWKIFHLSSPGQISTATQRAGIEYLWLPSRDTLKAFEAHLTEPYFSLAKKEGNARLYRVHPRKITTQEMEQKVLLQDVSGKVLLKCEYGSDFFPPEMQTGLETARWMPDDAIILLNASLPLKGMLTFTAYAFQEPRELELFLNNKSVTRKAIMPKGTRISTELDLPAGTHELKLDSIQGASIGNAPDRRPLSFRIWNLQFSTRIRR